MAAIKYLDLAGLRIYDAQIKTKISEGDAKAIKNFVYDEATRTLKFYKAETVAEGAVADFTMTLPADVDISGLLEKLEGATEGNVIVADVDGKVKDGGVALADLTTKEEVEAVDDKADANAEAIEAINNETTGILAQAKTYADGKDESIAEAKKAGDDAQADVDALEEKVGEVPEDKTVVQMIADAQIAATYDDTEVRELIADNAEAAKVTLTTAETATEGYLKTYVITQGTAEIGKINIPKELVVTAGEVVANPDGQPEGTYIKLTIANQEAPIYINVKDLVDAYTAQQNATQIQLVISDTNEVSATIVAGSVGTTELADGAVTAVKLAEDAKTLFDASGSANTAEINAKKHADDLNTAMDTRVDALEELVGEGTEAISTDEINALFEEVNG